MNFKVCSEIQVYEIDGEDVAIGQMDGTKLKIRSHWNRNNRVVLDINGIKITVIARDLELAVQNARNSGI